MTIFRGLEQCTPTASGTVCAPPGQFAAYRAGRVAEGHRARFYNLDAMQRYTRAMGVPQGVSGLGCGGDCSRCSGCRSGVGDIVLPGTTPPFLPLPPPPTPYVPEKRRVDGFAVAEVGVVAAVAFGVYLLFRKKG